MQFQHARTMLGTGDEQPVRIECGACDRIDPSAIVTPRVPPINSPGIRIQSGDAGSRPADEDTATGLFDNDGRGVGCRLVKSFPSLVASPFIESDDAGATRTADLQNHKVTFHKWCGGDSPR